MIDLLINNVAIITVDPQRRIYRQGTIAIDKGIIINLDPQPGVEKKFSAKTVVDGTHFLAMPGLTNAHMHLPQVLMRGVYDNIEAMDKLKNYTWPIQGCYDEQDALISTRLGLLEMIKSGTTSFLSTGLHPRYGIPAILDTILESGMRAVVSKYVMDIAGYALDESAIHPGMWETGEDSKRISVDLIQQWDIAGDGRLHVWISPRSVGGCSLDLLKWTVITAREYGVGITAHWSEVQNNVDYTLAEFGLRPVQLAEKIGMLGPDVTFAHGIYLDDEEMDLLARTRTNIVHCPICNSKLAMGVARVPQMLRKGVNVAMGNDGMGVNNTADMFREMRTMILLHRATQNNPLFPTAGEAIEMATINGARAMMADKVVGSLEVGKRADIILINMHQPHLEPLHDLVSPIAWAVNGSDVDTAIIDGKIVMQNRRVLTLDEEKILADAENIKDKILYNAGVCPQHVWPEL